MTTQTIATHVVHLRSMLGALPSERVSGLHVPLHEVESLMTRVVLGPAAERAGAMASEHLDGGGKRLRARLAIAACDALGVTRDASIPWAAAVELLHNATLVHDDLQDGDTVRRGRPTTWSVHGAAQAINCGDLMLVSPAIAIDAAHTNDATRYRLCRSLARHAMMCVRGQATDLELRALLNDPHVNAVERYLQCIAGKTGALFALPIEGAAVLAGVDPTHAEAIAEPFGLLGQLFQLQDDVLDLFGEKGRGERGCDIREGKISALVVEHLRHQPQHKETLLSILDAPRDATTTEQVEEVICRFESGGALDAVLQRMIQMATRAHQASSLHPYPALQSLVVELVGQVLRPIQHLFANESSTWSGQ
jgi:geranylgeranyl diphosphate synthase, type I